MSNSVNVSLMSQYLVLKKVAKDYPGKTIENVIAQIRARLDEFERQNKLDNERKYSQINSSEQT